MAEAIDPTDTPKKHEPIQTRRQPILLARKSRKSDERVSPRAGCLVSTSQKLKNNKRKTMLEVASNIGCMTSSIQDVLKGKASLGIAGALNTTTSSVQDVLDGRASPGVASAIGCTTSSLQDVLDGLNPEGCRGFIIGLACQNKHKK